MYVCMRLLCVCVCLRVAAYLLSPCLRFVQFEKVNRYIYGKISIEKAEVISKIYQLLYLDAELQKTEDLISQLFE